jgi:AraC-like DNA-binding protein
MSLLKYGLNIFLKEAEQLLIKTETSISEIVKELGFFNS